MKFMDKLLDAARDGGRSVMNVIARGLNKVTFGKLHPNVVTMTGLIAHVPIAYLIAVGDFVVAAALLLVFGLFDALDGSLARLQKRSGNAGMVLDATTDRMKEVILYIGAAYYFIYNGDPKFAIWAVAACGGSLLVSYVKAKGETAVKDAHLSPNEINKLFSDGLMRFEVRMFILIVGLLADYLWVSVIIIAVLAWLTAFQRLLRITKKLA
jgi:phosphatidylglycerophosphate synthase